MNTTNLERTTNEAEARTKEVVGSATTWRRPHFDVSEGANCFEVTVNLPGVNRAGVDISLEGEDLRIVGKRSDTAASSGRRLLRRELPLGDYRLNFQVNVPINEEAIEAQVTDGVLYLTLPKADLVKPRKIKVS